MKTITVAIAVLFASCDLSAQQGGGLLEKEVRADAGPSNAVRHQPWVTPPVRAPGVDFRTFESRAANARVSFHIYLPEAYPREQERRFPVLYWLHGSGGGLRGIPQLARLGFKYPDVFRAVSIVGAGPMQPELVQTPRAGRQRAAEVLQRVYGGDQAYFRSVSPRTLAEQNAEAIAEGSLVRIVIGDQDETFENNRAFHKHLERLKIPHGWTVLRGVAHDPISVLSALGDDNWAFYRTAFAALDAPASTTGEANGKSVSGAQILRKDKPGDPWFVEKTFGPDYLRVDSFCEATFTQDKGGKKLALPVTPFIAGLQVDDTSGATSMDSRPTVAWRATVAGQSDAVRRRLPVRSGNGHIRLPRVMRGVGAAPDGCTYAGGSFLGTVQLGGIELTSAGGPDTMLAAFNQAGQVKWFKRFGGAGADYVFDVACDSRGAVLVTGMCSTGTQFDRHTVQSLGFSDAFTAKLDADGTALWVATAGGHRLSGGPNIFLLKLSSEGVVLWARRCRVAAAATAAKSKWTRLVTRSSLASFTVRFRSVHICSQPRARRTCSWPSSTPRAVRCGPDTCRPKAMPPILLWPRITTAG